jgi:hypothetical protein
VSARAEGGRPLRLLWCFCQSLAAPVCVVASSLADFVHDACVLRLLQARGHERWPRAGGRGGRGNSSSQQQQQQWRHDARAAAIEAAAVKAAAVARRGCVLRVNWSAGPPCFCSYGGPSVVQPLCSCYKCGAWPPRFLWVCV